MNKKSILICLLLVCIVGVVYFLLNRSPRNQNVPLDVKTLKSTGLEYKDSLGVYSFLYPRDYRLDVQDNLVRIVKREPNQQADSQLLDGVIMVFESVDLQGKTLEQVVDTTISESTANGNADIAVPKQEVNMAGNIGYQFELSGFGSFTYTYLQKDKSSNFAVKVTSSVSDLQQRGYYNEVDVILSAMELMK